MRLIILGAFFLIPLIGFSSFPVQTTTLSDTTIDTKKETMEEYKIRIQKQLYKPTKKTNNQSSNQVINKEVKNNYNNKDKSFFAEIAFLIGGIILFLIGNTMLENNPSLYSGFLVLLGVISFLLGLIILSIELITRLITRTRKS
tara:strand:- start:557 stop:988 length:432 start_codon:yes stop_codon:yes gene_type:complete